MEPQDQRQPVFPARQRGRGNLVTLALLCGCLLVAATLAITADWALEARRRDRLVAVDGGEPPLSPAFQEAVKAKSNRAARSDTRLNPGSEAPDFTLPDISGRSVTLSNFRGQRPVVLIFGSFGCDLFCGALAPLRRLFDVYRGQVEFLFIYTSEVPHNSTPLPHASRPIPPIGDGAAARLRRIRWYQEESGGGPSWLLDGDDERVEKLYNAWPRRLVLVGRDGRVILDAGHGFKKGWDLASFEEQLRAAAAPASLHQSLPPARR